MQLAAEGDRTMPRRRLLLMTACLLAPWCPSDARAGTYDVYSCWAGSDSFRNPSANGSAWAKSSPYPERFTAFDQCGGTDNGLGVIAVSGYDAPSGQFGEVTFGAAPGTAVTRVRLYRTAWSYGRGSGGASERNYLSLVADGRSQPLGDNFDGSNEVPYGAAGS